MRSTRGRRPTGRPVLLLGLCAVLGLPGCAGSAAPAAEQPPAVLEPAGDGAPARITLSERAEQRLGLRTADVAPVAAGAAGVLVPYAALVYGTDGSASAFTRVAPHTYARTALTVAAIVGDQVTVSAGPPAGTPVVVVGAAELVGVESGIDGEE